MRRSLALLVALAVVLVAAPPAGAAKLTPEQKAGAKLVKDAAKIGKAFRNEQRRENKGFIRATKKLTKFGKRSPRTAADAIAEWFDLYSEVLTGRKARQEQAYADYEALYAKAPLGPGKDVAALQLGLESAQRGVGVGLAGDAFADWMRTESHEFPADMAKAVAPLVALCDAQGCPIATQFAGTSLGHPDSARTPADGRLEGAFGLSEGSVVAFVRRWAGDSGGVTVELRRFRTDPLENIVTDTVRIDSPEDLTRVQFDDLVPGLYYLSAEFDDFTMVGQGRDVLCVSVPVKPVPGNGGGGGGGTWISLAVDGEDVGITEVVDAPVEIDSTGRVIRFELIGVPQDANANTPTVHFTFFDPDGFDAVAGETTITSAFQAARNFQVTFDADGPGNPSPELVSTIGNLTIGNVAAIDTASPGESMTCSASGELVNPFNLGGAALPYNLVVTVDSTDDVIRRLIQ